MTTKAYGYQKEGVQRIQQLNGRALLADEMGLGKTFQALLWAWMFLDEGPYLVVCPATLKNSWRREAREHLNLRTVILNHRLPPANFKPSKKTTYIINYEILGNPLGKTRTWSQVLKRMQPTSIFFDEGQYLMNSGSGRSLYSKFLTKGVKHVLILTGTPLTRTPAQLWSLLNIIKPKLFPSKLRFLNRYTKPEWTPWGIVYKGGTRLKELHRILKKHVMIRRRKKDVLKDLPKKTQVVIQVDLSDNRQYRAAEKDFKKWLRQTYPNRVNKARRAKYIMKAGYLLRLIGELKLKAVKKWIEDFLSGSEGKLVCFGYHKKVVQPLHKAFKKVSVRIDGSVHGDKRIEAEDRFNDRKKVRILFGNIKAAGIGLNLQVANKVMFAELTSVPADITQAEARVDRIGQKLPVTSYFLVGKDTIEEPLLKKLQERQEIIDKVLDGKVGKKTLPIWDKLEEALMKGSK